MTDVMERLRDAHHRRLSVVGAEWQPDGLRPAYRVGRRR